MSPTTRLPGFRSTRLATIGLGVIISSLAAFGIAVEVTNASITRRVVVANRVSQDFERARFAVAEEESLERKYRLDPSPEVRQLHLDAARELEGSLSRLADRATGLNRDAAFDALARHYPYLAAINGLFAAVDNGDAKLGEKIDAEEIDPQFDRIRALVSAGADRSHNTAARELSRLQRQQRLVLWATPLFLGLALGLLSACVIVIRRFRSGIEHQALHDSLTGLPNRVLLRDRLGQALVAEGRNGTSTAVLLLDLDRFKEINDTLGHAYGDDLLRQVGPRLTQRLRDTDTVARLGGDEFAVLLPNISSPEAAAEIATQLVDLLAQPFNVDGLVLSVEVSIGVAVSPDHGTNVDTLLQRADIAMYIAKEAHSGTAIYATDLDHNNRERLNMLGELREAIEAGQLEVYYQPKGNLPGGHVVGAEALVRWNHPTRGLVRPDEFIPLAERTSLIQPLTNFVLRAALQQCRAWLDQGLELTIAVNLSARSMFDAELLTTIDDLLRETGVPPERLELEITESAVMIDPERARDLLCQLAAMGVHLAIDDFGTGYSSLAYLKTLPVHTIKIDRSFVMGMQRDHSDAVIVHSVIDLGKNLGLSIVAEGLEDEASRDELALAGCDLAQGYLWSPPLPAAEFGRWLATRTVASLT